MDLNKKLKSLEMMPLALIVDFCEVHQVGASFDNGKLSGLYGAR